MASAYPVAAYLVFSLFGLVAFPVLWWLLAFWQKRRGLRKLSQTSLYWSVTPIAGFGALYIGAKGILVPPMVAGIFFFLIPVVNVVALIITAIITVAKIRTSVHHAC